VAAQLTQDRTTPETTPARPSVRSGIAWGVALVAVVLYFVIVAHNASSGVQGRIANPAVRGTPRPVSAPLGLGNWAAVWQVWAVIQLVVLAIVFVVMWRRYPKHPILLMVLASVGIVWQDPIMNWAPYAVYDPRLWHFPVTWPLVSLSPTVEPFIVLGYPLFYMAPYFPAIWILRRMQRRRPVESFVSRHPLLSLSALIFVIGFAFDAMQEIFLVRTGLYIYSHVIPFGSVFTGTPYQFPLLWESILVTTVMIPAGVLLYRDDTGRCVAEKLARRIHWGWLERKPALGTFLVMFAILNFAYLFLYGGSFALIRASGAATSVACPYPYPEAKVYDPQGQYEKAGQPGPYYPGIWSGWETAQSGRPHVTASTNGRCRPTG